MRKTSLLLASAVWFFSSSWAIESLSLEINNMRPTAFVELLKQSPETPYRIPKVGKAWLSKIELAQFAKLIDVNTPCSMVFSELDSFFVPKESTISDEVYIILYGAMKQSYPPNSRSMALAQKNEVRNWVKNELKVNKNAKGDVVKEEKKSGSKKRQGKNTSGSKKQNDQ